MKAKSLAALVGVLSGYLGTMEKESTTPTPNGCTNCKVECITSPGNPCGLGFVLLAAHEPPCILDTSCVPIYRCWGHAILIIRLQAGGSVTPNGGPCQDAQANPAWPPPPAAPVVPAFTGVGEQISTNGKPTPPDDGGIEQCNDSTINTLTTCTSACGQPCQNPCTTTYGIRCVPCYETGS
jgi:hypothetical protein